MPGKTIGQILWEDNENHSLRNRYVLKPDGNNIHLVDLVEDEVLRTFTLQEFVRVFSAKPVKVDIEWAKEVINKHKK